MNQGCMCVSHGYMYQSCTCVSVMYTCISHVYMCQSCIYVLVIYMCVSHGYMYQSCICVSVMYICIRVVYVCQSCIHVLVMYMCVSHVYMYQGCLFCMFLPFFDQILEMFRQCGMLWYSICTFTFDHCVVYSSSIYGFWLPLLGSSNSSLQKIAYILCLFFFRLD